MEKIKAYRRCQDIIRKSKEKDKDKLVAFLTVQIEIEEEIPLMCDEDIINLLEDE